MTEEEVKQIDQVVETPKKKKKKTDEDMLELDQMRGSDVVRLIDFLHRRYLSWMTEAESAKFSALYKSARDEALKETIEVYNEIQKQNQQLLERMEKLIQALEGKLTATEQIARMTAQQTLEQAKKSILEDPRIRALGYIVFDYLSSKDPNLAKYKDIVRMILLPETAQANEQHTQ